MKKAFAIIAVLLIFLLSLWLGYYFYQKNKKDPVVYKTESLTKMNIVKKTVATGSINPEKEVNIKSAVSGVVEEVFIKPGEEVKVAQKIAKIKLVPSPVNISNAKSNLDLTKVRYEEAKKELERQKSINSKGQDVAQTRIAVQEAEKELARQKPLFDDGIISEQAYNQFVADLDIKRNQLEVAQTGASRSLSQYELDVSVRKREYQAAVENLDLLRDGASKQSGQVSNIVESTVSGMVLDVPAKEGNSVTERNTFNDGSTIATIADMQSMIFEGKVDESEVGKLKEGMDLVLKIGAIEGETYSATLDYISPKGVTEEGTIKFDVKATVDLKKGQFIRAGYSANADIVLAKKDSVMAIKESVLQFNKTADSTFVEIQTGDQEFEKKHIQTGLSDGIFIEVTEGLSKDDKVKVP